MSILRQVMPGQGDEESPSLLPADVSVGFNPMDIRNRLLEAIDQSQINIFTRKRHVDYPKVVAVLKDLTAEQAAEVQQAYEKHESRSLWEDIAGGGESGFPSDLSRDQLNRIGALLGGTRPSSAENAEDAMTNRLTADAAELHELLYGDLEEADVERVMTLLRRSAAGNVMLANAYERRYPSRFAVDLAKLPLGSQERARMLVAGQSAAADAFQVGVTRYRIAALNAKIDALKGEPSSFGALDSLAVVTEYRRRKLREQRAELIQDLESRLEMSGAEAEAQAASGGAGPSGAAAVRDRVVSVLGDVNAVAADIGGPDEAVIRAIASADPGAKAAARLRRLEAIGKLDAAAITAALRALRAEADENASRRHPAGDDATLATERQALAAEYFRRLKEAWDESAVGHGPSFDELTGRGNETEAKLNWALARGSGRTDDVTELVLALSGDRKDLETAKRVLSDKNAAAIAQLMSEYKARTSGRSLDSDLFGDETVQVDEAEDSADLLRKILHRAPGKASGTDRLILEDYLQRPSREGGLEEVNYLASRAEREYKYAIDSSGATGWWRDTWGNEARSLLDETIRDVRRPTPEPQKDLPGPKQDLPEPKKTNVIEPQPAPQESGKQPALGAGRRLWRLKFSLADRIEAIGDHPWAGDLMDILDAIHPAASDAEKWLAALEREVSIAEDAMARTRPAMEPADEITEIIPDRDDSSDVGPVDQELIRLRTQLQQYGQRGVNSGARGRRRRGGRVGPSRRVLPSKRLQSAERLRSALDDVAKRGDERAIRTVIESIKEALANEAMPIRSDGMLVEMTSGPMSSLDVAMAAEGLDGIPEWDEYKKLVLKHYKNKGWIEIGPGRSDDPENFARTEELRVRFLEGIDNGEVDGDAAVMMDKHISGVVRRAGSEDGAVAAKDAIYIDRFSGYEQKSPGPNTVLWPADPAWGVWRVDHIVEIQHLGADHSSNLVAAPQRMHSAKSRASNRFARAIRSAEMEGGWELWHSR